MAEVFALIGLIANVAQFVEHGRAIFSDARGRYHSGLGVTEEAIVLEKVMTDIRDTRAKLAENASTCGAASEDNQAVSNLASDAVKLSGQLLELLSKLKVRGDARFSGAEALRQAIRGIVKKREIERLEKSIHDIDKQINSRILYLFADRQSSISVKLNELLDVNKRIGLDMSTGVDNIVKYLRLVTSMQPKHNKVQTSLSNQLQTFRAELENTSFTQEILKSLCFNTMKQRYSDIKRASQKTLGWALLDENVRLKQWLQHHDGIYWVSGKAGSGKSTLMKFICDNPRTYKTLRKWAGAKSLVTASFYFLNAGFPMQRSQQGLLQSLLYQVFRSCPSLVSRICDKRNAFEPWTCFELTDTLKRSLQETALDMKFCFFIDGLDEYEGDSTELVEYLQDLISATQNIKLCASSRPWSAFVNAFADGKFLLKLEDLTKGDMHLYVTEMLEENDIFRMVASEDAQCASIAHQITKKAQGVWLWVYLVVRNLLRDLNSGEDEYSHLKRRLDEFPSELDDYFARIMDKIDTIYREETARIFLVVTEALSPIPIESLKFLQQEQSDPDYALKASIQHINWESLPEYYRRWSMKLNNRCKDLLEIKVVEWENFDDTEDGRGRRTHCFVECLHRTVLDYLTENSSKLQERVAHGFEPALSLCNLQLRILKTFPSTRIAQPADRVHVRPVIRELIYYAQKLEQSGRSTAAQLDEMDSVVSKFAICKLAPRGRSFWDNSPTHCQPYLTIARKRDGHNSMLSLAVQASLRIYVAEKLKERATSPCSDDSWPLLDYAARKNDLIASPAEAFLEVTPEVLRLDLDMITLLLTNGANPNQKVEGNKTVWHAFLESDGKGENGDARAARYEVARLMIRHGADTESHVVSSKRTITISFNPFNNDFYSDSADFSDTLHRTFGAEQAQQLRTLANECRKPSKSIFWKTTARMSSLWS